MSHSNSVEKQLVDLPSWTQELLKQFSERQIVLLSGDLGAGKTQLVSCLLESMGCAEVHSPTYGLIHEYSISKRKNVFHIDLYRLEDEEDLESSGFWDLFQAEEGLIFIEWGSRLDQSLLPVYWELLEIKIEKLPEAQGRRYHLLSR